MEGGRLVVRTSSLLIGVEGTEVTPLALNHDPSLPLTQTFNERDATICGDRLFPTIRHCRTRPLRALLRTLVRFLLDR